MRKYAWKRILSMWPNDYLVRLVRISHLNRTQELLICFLLQTEEWFGRQFWKHQSSRACHRLQAILGWRAFKVLGGRLVSKEGVLAPLGFWCMWPGTTLCLGALLPCFGAMVPQLPVWVGPGVAWSVPSRAIGAWLSLPRFQRTEPPSSYRSGTPASEIWMEAPRQRNTMGAGSSKDVGSGPNQSREWDFLLQCIQKASSRPQWAWETDHWAKEDCLLWSLEFQQDLPVAFWTCLGPVTPFFILIAPFLNENVYPMSIQPLCFRSTLPEDEL